MDKAGLGAAPWDGEAVANAVFDFFVPLMSSPIDWLKNLVGEQARNGWGEIGGETDRTAIWRGFPVYNLTGLSDEGKVRFLPS